VEDAWEFANSSPFPDVEELYSDVYLSAAAG
jgi:TPP-dependent pyruvate/acetoin dehydrogenase alpha subunit